MKVKINSKNHHFVQRISALLSMRRLDVLKKRIVIVLLSTALALFTSFVISKKKVIHPIISKQIEIRGIYGSPEPFWKKNLRLSELGVNSIFIHHGSINANMIERAKTDGLKVFAEFATLNGKNYVDKHPEAWAIDQEGNKVQPATWFMGVCPTEPGFRQHRITELRELLRKFELDGIWMDYLHWHAQFEDPEPILPETCFCEHCLTGFQSASRVNVPDGNTSKKAAWILTHHDKAWRNWRCSVIADWVRDFKKIIKEEKPGALLGVYHCPWNDADFNGARRRTLGLDYDTLKKIVDVFSPMVYHGRMGKSAAWVKENIEWFSKRLDIEPGKFPKVWPIVQAYNDPNTISAEEFEKVLQYGLAAQATGVMMFTSNSVAEDDLKIATMKKVYREWIDKK
jgi:Glycosyl hydrolase-like 10